MVDAFYRLFSPTFASFAVRSVGTVKPIGRVGTAGGAISSRNSRHCPHPSFDQRKSLWDPRRRDKERLSERSNKSYQLRAATLATRTAEHKQYSRVFPI